MALSDCVKCFDTPCMCGHAYRRWPTNRVEDLIAVLEKERRSRFEFPVLSEGDVDECLPVGSKPD